MCKNFGISFTDVIFSPGMIMKCMGLNTGLGQT